MDAGFDLARAQMRNEATRSQGLSRFKKCLEEWKLFCQNILYNDECNLYFNQLFEQQNLILSEGLISIPDIGQQISLIPQLKELCQTQRNNILQKEFLTKMMKW
jgi:hypothetical protein